MVLPFRRVFFCVRCGSDGKMAWLRGVCLMCSRSVLDTASVHESRIRGVRVWYSARRELSGPLRRTGRSCFCVFTLARQNGLLGNCRCVHRGRMNQTEFESFLWRYVNPPSRSKYGFFGIQGFDIRKSVRRCPCLDGDGHLVFRRVTPMIGKRFEISDEIL